MATELAKAYVQIIPSAEGIKGKLSDIMNSEAASAGKSSGSAFSSAMGGMLKGAGALTAAAIGTAVGGVTALTKAAVSGAADFEQLWGGVQKLYGTAGQSLDEYAKSVGKTSSEAEEEYNKLSRAQMEVLSNAKEAYKTSGLDMNTYMEQATGFSAALISSLGGDTMKAAEMTDTAMRAISDNVNTFGSDMSAVTNAFMGFSKQNYTMLDNLKLGYGGTKTEMERLITDASKMTDIQKELNLTVKDGDTSFANIVAAIQVMQEKMGIAGTTLKEAEGTISGSLGMLKASWANFTSELAMGSGDLPGAIDALVKSATSLFNNVTPVIETAMSSIGEALEEIAPVIGEKLPPMIEQVLPSLVSATESLLNSLGAALPGLLESVLSILPGLLDTAVNVLLQNLPALIDVAAQAMLMLANGLAQNLPTLIPQIVDIALTIVDTLTNNVDLMVEAAVALIQGLTEGMIQAIPILIARVPEIVVKIAEALVKNIPILIGAEVDAITQMINTLGSYISPVVSKIGEMGAQAVAAFKKWLAELPTNMAYGAGQAIASFAIAIEKLPSKVADVTNKAIQKVKEFGRKLIDEGPGKAKTFVNDFLTAMKELPEGLYKAGVAAVESLWKGLSEKWEWLKNQASGLASSLIKGIKDKFASEDSGSGKSGGSTNKSAASSVSSSSAQSASSLKAATVKNETSNTFNNTITVNGAQDPEAWTQGFVRTLKREARMA